MSTAAEVLVIILSIVLALFLILGIILTIMLMRVTRRIKKITESAGRTVDSIETTVGRITRISSPIFITRMIMKYVNKFRKSK